MIARRKAAKRIPEAGGDQPSMADHKAGKPVD